MRLTFTLTIVHPVEYIVTCRIYETCKIEVWCNLEVSALFMRCTSNAHNLLLIIKTVECLENLCSEWKTGGEKGTWGISLHCPLQCRTGSICIHACVVPDALIRVVSSLQPLRGTSWVSPAAHPAPLSPWLKEPACKLASQLFPGVHTEARLHVGPSLSSLQVSLQRLKPRDINARNKSSRN